MKIKRLFQIFALVLGCATVHAQVTTEAWVQRYNRDGVDPSELGTAIATDPAGNVIVAGVSESGVTGTNWLIIKYTGAGVPVWTNHFDGPGNNYFVTLANNSDCVNAVAVAPNGTIFVTGYFHEGSSTLNYGTVAYSEAGVPLWTNRYTGIGSALAVSPNGTVFATGTARIPGIPDDFGTIAYSEAGVPLWTNRYNGPGNSTDQATAVALGSNGNVFVTGYSSFAPTIASTVAYTAAGVPLWSNLSGGTGLAVGPNGNVFVTGFGTTSAYTEAGGLLWTNRYSSVSNRLAVSPSGNVFVTGASPVGINGSDFATIAYSGTGMPLWTNFYNGPGNSNDTASAIAVSPNGIVFVTGTSIGSGSAADYATIAYSEAGVPLWTNRYNGPANNADQATALTVGPDGTVFVTGASGVSAAGVTTVVGNSSYDCTTIAYTEAGVPLWTNRYNGPEDKTDSVAAVAVGANGSVFVTGTSLDSLGFGDYSTIAYSSAGTPLWTNLYSGLSGRDDLARAVAVGADGRVFVSGYGSLTNSPGAYAYTTIAYSGAGVPLWTNHFPSSAIVDDLAVTPNGTVIVSGSYFNKSSYNTILALSGDGVPLWNRTFGAFGRAIAVGPTGNIYLTGNNFYATAYSEAGVSLWTNNYTGGPGFSFGNAVTVGPDGTVFVAGQSVYTGDLYIYTTVAYSATGVQLWVNHYQGPAAGSDSARAVAVSPSGNVFVTGGSFDGHTYNGSGASDYATIAYSGAGVPLWTNRFDGPAHSNDVATTVAVTTNGTVFVSGYSHNGVSYDYVTIAYSEAGVPLSTNRYNGAGDSDDLVLYPHFLATTSDGVVVAGNSGSDFAVVKYVSTADPTPPTTSSPPPAVITRLPNGDAQLKFYGGSGASYVLEHTFDLASNSWMPVQTNSAALNGEIVFLTPPLSPINFWRIRPLP